MKHLRGSKTDIADSEWLACVCQLGLARASHVPPRAFRQFRPPTRECQFHTFHRTLTARRGYRGHRHKLVRTFVAVLHDAKPYHDPETDYEALLVR